MKYDFGQAEWKKDFRYVYSLVASSFCEFSDENGHIANGYNENVGGYDYISIAHKDTFGLGARASVKCSFDHYGAPLLTFANDIRTDESGRLLYGDHYEVVAYEGGCNVWYITKAEEGSERPFKVASCLKLRFPIEEKSVVDMSVELLPKAFRVEVNGVCFELPAPFIAERVHIGITACEGINRLYSLTVESKNA